ncbi:MAG TPA: trigger factor, partial [Dehalococcoidales bacterium]|nr:trigger factor [Dehalococcoidales bacterium]
KAYQNACKEQSLEPYAQPSVEVTQVEPLIFKAVVPLAPTVELNDYKSIHMTPEPVEVKDSDVDAVIEQLRHQHATWEPVDRPLAMNDLATIDINAMVDEKPYVRKAAAQYQLNEANITPAPNFPQTIVGMKKEEEKEFDLPFPADYPSKELAGKTAHFKVKLHEIKEEKLPELNDEFPKQISTDIKTLDALKEEAKKNLKQRLEDQARMNFEEKVVTAAIEKANVCFPPVLIDIEINRIMNEQARQLQMSGKGMEEYLRSINKTPQQLQEDLRPVATKNVTASLLLEKLAEAEKVEVTEGNVDARLDNMVLGVDNEKKAEMRKFFDNPQTRASIKQQLMARKTIEVLANIAKGENDKGVKEEEKK